MTPAEQRKFIQELGGAVLDELLRDCAAGKLPPDWDGLELRRLMALRFRRACIGELKGQRKQYFENEVLVRDL
jgi:hypothetical protein